MATMVGPYFHRLGHFKGPSALYGFGFLESIARINARTRARDHCVVIFKQCCA